MKSKVIVLICLFVNLISLKLGAQDLLASKGTPESIRENLIMNQKWVPFPDYSNRSGWDQLLGKNKATLIQRGERQLKYQWKIIKATDYLEYERTGERNIMQNPNSDNGNALSDLVMAELAEGKGRFIDQIINGVFMQCERTSWVLSAHLTAQHSKRTLPDHTEQVIDLGSGDLGGFLAWTYYFFNKEFDKVNPIISKRLHKELYDRIILPYRNEDRFWWMGFKPREDGLVNNWNPWCNFNVLQCMLLLENDPAQLSKDVYRTMLSTDKFINYVKADGACEEGPSYWGHAAGKLYDYLKILSLATNGKVSIFDNKMIKDMGEYMPNSYVGNDWVVNFADASARFSSNAGLIYRYGEAVNSPEMMHFSSYLIQNGKSSISYGLDIFREMESLAYDSKVRTGKAALNTPEVIEYPETQFYYIKNKNGFFLATKGGHNAESHNHNDIGTFTLYYKQIPIFIDAGVGTYVRQTFGPERYTIWTMRSNYHNLPSINGVEQKDGREYKASDIKFDAKNKAFSVNIGTAYPKEANVNQWLRSYQLKSNELIIKDDFSLSKAEKANESHFMLWGKIDISQHGKVIIDVQNMKMQLIYDGKQFEPVLETIELPDTRLSSVWGKEIYRLTLKAKNVTTKSSYEYKIRPL